MKPAAAGTGRKWRWSRAGLLRWLARWLRWRSIPAWLEPEETGPGPGYSKEALKELIERKRQNDFVRKREFEHLRRLRRREPVATTETDRFTSFQSSLASSDLRNRAATIRKINEIEAQMSRQWLGGEKDAVAGSMPASAVGRGHARAAQAAPVPPRTDSAPSKGASDASAQAPWPRARADDAVEPLSTFFGADSGDASKASAPPSAPDLDGMAALSGLAYDRSAPPSEDDGHVWNDANPSALPGLPAQPVPSPALNSVGTSASAWPAVPMPADPGREAWRASRLGGPAGLGGVGTVGGGWRGGVLPQLGASAARAIFARPLPPPAPDHLADPDLEDAAIRYANGDHEGAARSLHAALESALEAAAQAPQIAASSVLQALVRAAHGGKAPPPQLVETWLLACVDLARATGQQAEYERVARDWQQRYAPVYTHLAACPVPRWFSIPDRVGPGKGAVRLHRPALPAVRAPDWRSPARLDAPAALALQAKSSAMFVPSDVPPVVDDSTAALVLDWQALRVIAVEAVPVLARLFSQWCEAPASASLGLVFRGPTSLERALLALTHGAGVQAQASAAEWRLRMDALRLMRLRDAFELAALDYGVTHETQAPAWQEPLAVCLLRGPSDPLEAEAEDIRANWDTMEGSAWNGETLPGVSLDRDALGTLDVWIGSGADVVEPPVEGSAAQPVRVDLYGEIVGDATEVLAKLAKAIAGRTHMVVSCTDLIRVDFPAAGGLLNWAAEQQAQGRQVQLRDVHRLVAAFFNVIGISEHARVVPRSD
ncbi:STAS domain-containing protein [Hylemonella gracilis]|uniref:STAS domain-containing protein n=1 Tax=Hylemonella gracilis TaxID=80880 RepID=UPI001E2BDC13|nr:STAS domain-containing protein [Hylemonella gracilis]